MIRYKEYESLDRSDIDPEIRISERHAVDDDGNIVEFAVVIIFPSPEGQDFRSHFAGLGADRDKVWKRARAFIKACEDE